MKRFLSIFAVAVFLFSLLGCESELDCNKEIEDDIPNSEDIILPAGNYISFYTDIDSRASLVTEQYLTQQPFGVFGYQYDFSNSWNGQRAMAIPNVFWNEEGSKKVPLKVSYNNGVYNYRAHGAQGDTKDENGQVNWTSNRYAFWAYYPYKGDNFGYYRVSEMEDEGAPYITYTVDRTTTKNMYDVMTGGISQITAAGSGNTVTFTMYHRLSAVDVSISNVYEHEYTENGTNYTEDVDIIIKELQLQFGNLKYNTAKIFLERDKTIPSLNTMLTEADADDMGATYQLLGGDDPDISGIKTIEPTTNEKTNLTADNGATMTFIPQETTDLSVTTTVKYYIIGRNTGKRIPRLRVNGNGEPVKEDGSEADDENEFVYDGILENPSTGVKGNELIEISKETDFNQTLVEGTRYYIVLNFTSEAVSINIITAEAWEDVPPVDYEFK